jgi:hypothetical protein
MKNQPQQFKLSKIIKTAAIITGILALLEVLIIFFVMGKDHKNPASLKKPRKPQQVQQAASPDTNKAPLNNNLVIAEVPEKEIKTEPVKPANAIIKVEVDTVAKNVQRLVAASAQPVKVKTTKKIDTARKKVAAIKKPDQTIAVELTEDEMAKYLNEINAEKTRLNNTTRCIQVRKTVTSNVQNAFKLADYLKSRGFVISGRETIGGKQKGVEVNATGSCIKVTIGSI